MPSWLQPTALPIIVTAGVLCALSLAYTLVWVPLRPAPKKWKALVRQCVSVVLSIVLSLLLIFLVLNKTNSWYPSWASLRGAGAVAHNETVGKAEEPVVAGAATWRTGTPTPAQADPRTNPAFGQQTWQETAPAGQYVTVNIAGVVSGKGQRAMIWLPASYLSHPERFYPIVVAFAGVPGAITSLSDGLKIGAALTTLVSEQKLRETVIVVPDVFPNNVDTECIDSADGSVRMETFVASDVVSWVKTNLRVSPERADWATFGYSAGGYCSSMIAMRHPETFGASINMSGYFTPHFDGTSLRPADDTAYDLNIIAAQKAPDVRLWFYNAKDDPMPQQSWEVFKPKVKSPTSLTTVLIDAGGHSTPVWLAGQTAGFTWLGQTQPGFGPVAP